MKKIILVAVAILGMAVVAVAQPRAIGVRVGYGAELSYQHTLGGENFGQLDLGWSAGAFSAGLAYDFQVAPLGPLNFFAGPQVNLALANADGQTAFGMGVGAHLGLEYCFNFPLQLSLDWKPTFVFIPGTAFGWASFGLGIRYLF